MGKSCGKFLQEILAGQGGGEKANLRKAVIGGNLAFGIRGWISQPIRIQLGKILRENLLGNSCRKILQENLVGKSCGKILWENLAGNSCGKFLQEILVGQGGGEKANLRKAVIGGNLAIGIG